MAKSKVSGISSLRKSLSNRLPRQIAKAVFAKKDQIEGEIVATIIDGKSPVKGKTFPNYSPKYAKIKGKIRPVDLFQTGELLRSIETRIGNGFSVIIRFKSKIAKFHDKLGAGKSKVIRRMLPDPSKGESFRSNIAKVIRRAISKGIK